MPMIGWHTINNSVAFTEYDLEEGDVLMDAFEDYYAIKSNKKWTIGNQLKYAQHSVELLDTFPFLSGFFGFVDEEHTTSETWFGDGFMHGYFAL